MRLCDFSKRFIITVMLRSLLIASVSAVAQPKDDIVKFWQSVVGPKFDIVVRLLYMKKCTLFINTAVIV